MVRGKWAVLDLSREEAKRYFMKSENYFTVPVPSYFEFEWLLEAVDKKMAGRSLWDFCEKEDLLNAEGVNYGLMSSKDGLYGARVFRMIHP